MLVRRRYHLVIGAVAAEVGSKPIYTALIILTRTDIYIHAATRQDRLVPKGIGAGAIGCCTTTTVAGGGGALFDAAAAPTIAPTAKPATPAAAT